MEILLPAIGCAYGATFIWLVVSIINRPREWNGTRNLACAVLIAPLFGLCLLPGLDGRGHRTATRRSICKNNLKQIGLALHNYHEWYDCFPPAYIAGPDGTPWHSWRVLLLPFLDQQPLYNQYRFDEPWDGPHNRQLAGSVQAVFRCPADDHGGAEQAATMTSYVAIIGPGLAWPGSETTAFRDFLDGSSTTILVAEVANSGIHWLEPRDLHLVQMAPTINAKAGQGISSRHKEGAHILLTDGAVRFVGDKTPAVELRAWLTIDAGDRTNDF